MGLGMRRLDRAQDVVEQFDDDAEDTFLTLCGRGPTPVCGGASRRTT
ncbi:hypothetical protein ACPB9J_10155 [Streptomyces lavendulocolor]